MELKELTAPLLKWWWLLVASTVVAAVASFLAVRQQPPVYSAKTTMMIGSAIEDPNPTSNQVWMSQQLATTYADIVGRAPVRNATMEALGLTWLPGYSARPIQNTQLLEIVVTDTDPLRCQAVANELGNQLVLKSPTYSPESQVRQDFINLQLDELQIKIQETQDDINTKQDELANMVSARQIADTQSQISALQNKLITLQNNYAGLLINTQQGALNTLTMIETATAVQVGPNVMMSILTAAAIGLVLAAGAAYLLEYLDNSIKSPEDIKRLTGLPTLAGIAAFRGERYREKLITISKPRSPVSEAYRSLRTGIQFSTIDRPGNTTLMVTSPNPTEGKSVTIANLAVVFAQAGNKVLLIDADLRRPVQHRIFQVPNARGLTSYLLESNAEQTHEHLRALTIQQTGIEKLFILTSGPIPPNPSELLGSERMRESIQALSKHFDYVLLDSPPTMIVTDAAVLSRQTDNVLLVIDAGKTPRQHVKQATEHLREVNANLIGVVMNRLSPKSDGHYYQYYYYRKSYYRQDGEHEFSSNGHGPLGRLRQLFNGNGSGNSARRRKNKRSDRHKEEFRD